MRTEVKPGSKFEHELRYLKDGEHVRTEVSTKSMFWKIAPGVSLCDVCWIRSHFNGARGDVVAKQPLFLGASYYPLFSSAEGWMCDRPSTGALLLTRYGRLKKGKLRLSTPAGLASARGAPCAARCERESMRLPSEESEIDIGSILRRTPLGRGEYGATYPYREGKIARSR